MTRKVNVGLFDKDLKVEIKKYPLNSDGTKIEIVSGGEGHFMPAIDNESFLEFPSWKKYILFGERSYKRIYLAMKWSRKCVNFHTPEVVGPDPKEVIKAARAEIIKNYGNRKLELPWYLTVFLLLNFFLTIIIAHVLGVF